MSVRDLFMIDMTFICVCICAGNETFEKLGTVGSLTNLVVYLTTVFNMKGVTATTFLNVFSGTTNLAPLLGAYLTDTYFGRYKTLGFASISSFVVIPCFFITRLLNYSGKKRKGKDVVQQWSKWRELRPVLTLQKHRDSCSTMLPPKHFQLSRI